MLERRLYADLPPGETEHKNDHWPVGTNGDTPEFWTRDPANPRERVEPKEGLRVEDHPFHFPCRVCGRAVSSATDVVAMWDKTIMVCDRLHPGEER